MVRFIHKIVNRVKCRHTCYCFMYAQNIYSDICGYEYTKFVFRCKNCGKKHILKTTCPDTIWDELEENGVYLNY